MRVFFLVAILLQSFTLVAQNKKLDSLYQALEKLTDLDTARINTLIRICYYEHTAHPEKNKQLAEEVLGSSKKIHYAYGEGYGQRYLALYHWMKGNYELGANHGFEMLRVFEAASDTIGMAKAYAVLGLIHEEWEDFDKSKEYFVKSMEINERANRLYDVAYNLNSLGALHHHFSKYDEAEQYYLKSLELRKQIKDEDGISQSFNNLARMAKIKKDYVKALEYIQNTLAIAKKFNNTNRISIAYQGLGEIYVLQEKYAEAEPFLYEALSLAKQLRSKKRIKQVYGQLATLEDKRKDYKKAIAYLREEYKYQDSLFTEDKANQIAEMETRYETEKKEQAILLLERDKKIQTLWRNILIAGLASIVLISVAILLLFRYRARKNYELFNLRIDYLTDQNKELSQKYQHAITNINEDSIVPEENRILKKALNIVERHLANPLFGVEKMAEEIGMSRATLHRRLKTMAGISPSDFIRNVRLKRAATLLRKKADSITQVGFMVGFEDQSNFSKSFKRQFGVSPSDYASSGENS
jgi:AraC-like DNA-binding protein